MVLSFDVPIVHFREQLAVLAESGMLQQEYFPFWLLDEEPEEAFEPSSTY